MDRYVTRPIPAILRFCHRAIRTPFLGVVWLVFSLLVCTIENIGFVHYVIGLVFFLLSTITAWPAIILTPFSLIAALFFLSNLNEIGLVMYMIIWGTGVIVYCLFLMVQCRIISGRYQYNTFNGMVTETTIY